MIDFTELYREQRNAMQSSRKYDAWVRDLRDSDDNDLSQLGRDAKGSSWIISSIYDKADPKTRAEVMEALGCETEEDYARAEKEGWVTEYDTIIVTWYDGII